MYKHKLHDKNRHCLTFATRSEPPEAVLILDGKFRGSVVADWLGDEPSLTAVPALVSVAAGGSTKWWDFSRTGNLEDELRCRPEVRRSFSGCDTRMADSGEAPEPDLALGEGSVGICSLDGL